MTKKFTEEEYQKIVDCLDKANEKYNMGVMNPNLLIQVQDELFWKLDFINDWEDIFAIANPLTREWAHEQFVEKEKKYIWKYKKIDDDGDAWYLLRDSGLIVPGVSTTTFDAFTETEIIEAGYILDMYEKEEVD